MAVPEPPAGRPRRGPASSLSATLAARVEEIVDAAEREAAVIQRDLEAHRRACEAEAQRYLDEARRQADAFGQRRVERMRELTDELVERAEATRRQFDELMGALDRATTQLARDQDEEAELPRLGARDPSHPGAAAERRTAEAVPQAPASLRAGVRRHHEPIHPSPPPGDPPSRRSDDGDPPQAPGAPRADTPRRRFGGRRPLASPTRSDGVLAGDGEEVSATSLEAARLVAIEMAVVGRTRAEVDAHLRESFRITDSSALLDDVFGGGGDETPRSSWVAP